MEIRETLEFQVKKTSEHPDMTPNVLLENTHSKRQVEVLGKILEAQYRIGDNFLLLVTEGNPFEEALYIYYFDKSLQIKDSIELSAMYAEGMLRNLSVTNANTIQFSFFDNDERWLLKILPSPEWIFGRNTYPAKNRGSLFHKSWLRLKKA